MGAMSRRKGAVGERELAAYLTDHGFPATRGRQHHGGSDAPDVRCPALPFHFEVKRTESLRLHEAMAQAVNDAGDRMPVVAHRRNNGDWIAVLRLADLLRLMRPGA